MANYSRLAQGTFVSQGNTTAVFLPFVPDFIQIWNYANITSPIAEENAWAMWNRFMSPNALYTYGFTSSNTLTPIQLPSGGITPIIDGKSLGFEAPIAIADVTKANPAEIFTSSSHNYSNGDVVVLNGLYASTTTGMQQIAGIPFTVSGVSAPGATTFTINWNTNQSNYTAISGAAPGLSVQKVINPYLFTPGSLFISSMTLGTQTTVSLTTNHNMFVGQEVAFRIPQQWGPVQLNSNRNRGIPNAPIYGVVTSVIDAQNLIVNVDSSQFTAFNSNIPFGKYVGLSYAQLVAVGDYNMGGAPLTTTNRQLYPSPSIQYGVQEFTPNGPGILGSFGDNSRLGFLVGGQLLDATTAGNQFYWEARLHDYSSGVPISF